MYPNCLEMTHFGAAHCSAHDIFQNSSHSVSTSFSVLRPRQPQLLSSSSSGWFLFSLSLPLFFDLAHNYSQFHSSWCLLVKQLPSPQPLERASVPSQDKYPPAPSPKVSLPLCQHSFCPLLTAPGNPCHRVLERSDVFMETTRDHSRRNYGGLPSYRSHPRN